MPNSVLSPPSPSDETARKLRARIEMSARKARADPDFAARQGIVPSQAMSLFGNQPSACATPADWLRGAVAALLPRGWSYKIVDSLGGGAELILLEGPKPDLDPHAS